MNNLEEIKTLYADMTNALRNKDVAGATSSFADKSVMFLLAPPLRFRTGDESEGANGLEEWFDSFENNIGLEFSELEVMAGDRVAFLHCLVHLTGKRTDGTDTDVWYRETLGLINTVGQWKITHQHQSVPM